MAAQENNQQMAERVLRGMAKWPSVPSVYNWLQLDRRGRWLMKNSLVTHPLLVDFINQHYLPADDGSYYFQNGPQRVFVEILAAPYVVSLAGERLVTHNHREVGQINAAMISEAGDIYLRTDLGPSLVDDRSLIHVEQWLQAEGDREAALSHLLAGGSDSQIRFCWAQLDVDLPLRLVAEEELEQALGFVARPAPPDDGQEYCVE